MHHPIVHCVIRPSPVDRPSAAQDGTVARWSADAATDKVEMQAVAGTDGQDGVMTGAHGALRGARTIGRSWTSQHP